MKFSFCAGEAVIGHDANYSPSSTGGLRCGPNFPHKAVDDFERLTRFGAAGGGFVLGVVKS